MRVFVTGATGFIGSRVVEELIGAGHGVLGLARTKEKAGALAAAGAEALVGMIADAGLLTEAARTCDGAIHLAFDHDFADPARFLAICAQDRDAISALAAGFAGSDRPLVMTSGTAIARSVAGAPAREDGPLNGPELNPRSESERLVADLVARGANVSVMRLPQVHDRARQGLITWAIASYRAKGVCACVGDGSNRWPAAHVADVARLYRLALERAERGAILHAVAEEGVAMRDVADVLARKLALPAKSIPAEEAVDFFGWIGHFAGLDMPASSALTRARLRWTPTGPTLLADLENLETPAA